MEYKDYYKVLGIERTASRDEVKKAYRKLAMQYHPDRNPNDKGAEDKFKELNEAYQVLGDEQKRAHYDQLGSAYSQWERRGAPGGFDWSQWQQAGGPGNVHVEYSGDLGDIFGQGGSFSDFFQEIFGSMGGRQGAATRQRTRSSAAPRQSYQQAVTVSLEEAYHGGTRQVNVDGKRLELKLPAGARDGTKIRMRGAGPGGADIYLVVEVAADPRFTRKGDDLHTKLDIDLYTAVLGGEARVPTLNGSLVLTIPPGSQPGQSIRLKGKGMPSLKSPNQHGDLFAQLNVKIPKKLSAKEKELFAQLADHARHT